MGHCRARRIRGPCARHGRTAPGGSGACSGTRRPARSRGGREQDSRVSEAEQDAEPSGRRPLSRRVGACRRKGCRVSRTSRTTRRNRTTRPTPRTPPSFRIRRPPHSTAARQHAPRSRLHPRTPSAHRGRSAPRRATASDRLASSSTGGRLITSDADPPPGAPRADKHPPGLHLPQPAHRGRAPAIRPSTRVPAKLLRRQQPVLAGCRRVAPVIRVRERDARNSAVAREHVRSRRAVRSSRRGRTRASPGAPRGVAGRVARTRPRLARAIIRGVTRASCREAIPAPRPRALARRAGSRSKRSSGNDRHDGSRLRVTGRAAASGSPGVSP